MRKTLWTRLAIVTGVGGLLTACGDNILPDTGDGPDAAPLIDASNIDAEVPDAMVDVYTGTITVLEVNVFGATVQLGQGIQVGASFFLNGGVPPVYEESPGSITGCKVWEYTPEQAADPGLDEGTIAVSIDNTADPAFDPTIPTCVFLPTRGYICPDATQSPGGSIQGVPDPDNVPNCVPGALMLTDTDAPFTFALTDGRYVAFSGTTLALLPDGTTLPVVNKIANTTIVVGHPSVTSTCVPLQNIDAAGLHTTLGGVGPIPGFDNGASDQPGFLSDDADVAVTLTMGGDGDIETFTADFNPPGGPGDDFALNAASQALFVPGVQTDTTGIPLDGSSFTVACDSGAGEPCEAGTGDGVVLSIVTTDGPVTAQTPLTSMPAPTTKSVELRCAVLAGTSAVVPAAASAYLMNSGATKLQATFIRGELGGLNNNTTAVNVVVGHAITTFQVPAPPR